MRSASTFAYKRAMAPDDRREQMEMLSGLTPYEWPITEKLWHSGAVSMAVEMADQEPWT